MGIPSDISTRIHNKKGTVLIFVTIAILVLIMFAAFAIDLAYLFVIRNELKNAADAGALAGAQVLYNEDGTVYEGANQVAFDIARLNNSQNVPVDVHWESGQNSGDEVDVQRGHWRFATSRFEASDNLNGTDLWNVSTEDLDANPDFINAVRVKTRRDETRALSFFSRIFGYEDYFLSRESVAYIGFAGSLRPEDVDQPIGICRQSITDGSGNYTCNTGRMIDSSGGTTTNTGAWSNFSQPCETATPPSVNPLVCGGGNPEVIKFGEGMGTIGGMTDNVFRNLRNCWLNASVLKDWRGYPRERWGWTLPVIDCPGNNPGPCSVMVGAVTLDVIWINNANADPNWRDIPLQMEGWECSTWVGAGRPENIDSLTQEQRQQCWQEFATNFNLQTWDGTSVGALTPSQLMKTIFFLPSCEYHEPRGATGGRNFGILARIPVLVQ